MPTYSQPEQAARAPSLFSIKVLEANSLRCRVGRASLGLDTIPQIMVIYKRRSRLLRFRFLAAHARDQEAVSSLYLLYPYQRTTAHKNGGI